MAVHYFTVTSHKQHYAYIYWDALTLGERTTLTRQLNAHHIPYDYHRTSLGSNEQALRPVFRIDLKHGNLLNAAGISWAGHMTIPQPLANPGITRPEPNINALLQRHPPEWIATSKGYNLFFSGENRQSLRDLQAELSQQQITSVLEEPDSPFGRLGIRVVSASTQQAKHVLTGRIPHEPEVDYSLSLPAMLHQKNQKNAIHSEHGSVFITGTLLEPLRKALEKADIPSAYRNGALHIHPSYTEKFNQELARSYSEETLPAQPLPQVPPKITDEAIKQSSRFNTWHRIDTDEKIRYGYRDGGRAVKFDNEGNPITRANREIIVVHPPERDAALAAAIERAQNEVNACATVAEKADALRELVATLLPVNNPDANERIMNNITGGNYRGKEISLGELIDAQTGVCRHRSLLFKILADHTGLESALVRGNFLSPAGSGGHAWNEVKLENGERILVDAMHSITATAQDDYVKYYADISDNYLYHGEGRGNILLAGKRVEKPAQVTKPAAAPAPNEHALDVATEPQPLPPEPTPQDKEEEPETPAKVTKPAAVPTPDERALDVATEPQPLPPEPAPQDREEEPETPRQEAAEQPSGKPAATQPKQQDNEKNAQPEQRGKPKTVFALCSIVAAAALTALIGLQLLKGRNEAPQQGRGR